MVANLSYGEDDAVPCSENGECDVGIKTLVFFDKSRERPIITEVYYPPERGDPSLIATSTNFQLLKEKRNAPIPRGENRLPLIILSHGYKGDRYGHGWLQEILAANGYIVAVPDHFGNTHYMQRAEDSLKRWNRPKDVSFLIDKLLEDPLLKQHIDPNRIGFIGYSLGGLTGVWLAGGVAQNYPTPNMATSSFIELDEGSSETIIKNIDFTKAKKSYEDKRIKAEFLMAPSFGFAFSPEGLSSIDIPIMIVATEKDSIAPVKHNAQFYADNIKSSAIKVLSGKAGHYVFLNRKEQDGNKSLPHYLTTDDPSVDRSKIHEEVANMALKFFDKYLKGQSTNGKSL
jgi:predicted dienelactone hydrolase